MGIIMANGQQINCSENFQNLIDEWETRSQKYFNEVIPIEFKSISTFENMIGMPFRGAGELANTVAPILNNPNRIVLGVFLDDINTLNETIAAHEIMHYILPYDGFNNLKVNMINDPQNGMELERQINSFPIHIPLNKYLEERGFDYLPDGDRRAIEFGVNQLKEVEETPIQSKEFGLILVSLAIADMIRTSSSKVSNELMKLLTNVGGLEEGVKKVFTAIEDIDLYSPKGHNQAQLRLARILQFRKYGASISEVNAIRKLRMDIHNLRLRG